MRNLLMLIVTSLMLVLSGCGGGGGTTTNSGSSSSGGSSSGGTQVIATPGPPNVEKLVVDGGPTALTIPAVNTAFISVTVCMPGTNFTTCQTIDHIEVDTGSSGLRIIAGPPGTGCTTCGELTLALPPVADPGVPANVLGECLEFADGFSWGSVNTADIKLPVSGQTATGVIVHVIGATSTGDPSKASPTCYPLPAGPANPNPPPLIAENTVQTFGANGILGVGPFILDCATGAACAPLPTTCNGASPNVCVPGNAATYFSCTKTSPPSCTQTTVQAAQQLQNPASLFAANYNNGVIVELPAVGANGAPAPLTGSLVFGIGAVSNNMLSGATQLFMNTSAGTVAATLGGNQYPDSYLDSGSNANFFPTTSIASCMAPDQGFLCPPVGTTESESGTLQGTDGTMAAADFSFVNASNTLFPTGNAAFSNLAGSNYVSGASNTTLDLGLSFFYGHNVFTGFESNANGPYFAY